MLDDHAAHTQTGMAAAAGTDGGRDSNNNGDGDDDGEGNGAKDEDGDGDGDGAGSAHLSHSELHRRVMAPALSDAQRSPSGVPPRIGQRKQ